jgi:hypothetical protein
MQNVFDRIDRIDRIFFHGFCCRNTQNELIIGEEESCQSCQKTKPILPGLEVWTASLPGNS